MAERTWTGTTSGDIGLAANWGGSLPNTFNTPKVVDVSGAGGFQPSSGTLTLGHLILNVFSGTIDGGTWTQTGVMTVRSGATVRGGEFSSNSVVVLSGGMLTTLTTAPIFHGWVTVTGGAIADDGDFRMGIMFPSCTMLAQVALVALGDIRLDVPLFTGSGDVGTLALPTEAQVESGVGFGTDGTEFTGTLTGGVIVIDD